MTEFEGPSVPVTIPLSSRSAQLVWAYAPDFGGAGRLVRSVLMDADLMGIAPDPSFAPNGDRVNVRLPPEITSRFAPRAVGGLLDRILAAYDEQIGARTNWRGNDRERVRMEVSGGAVSRHLRVRSLQAGQTVEERASRLAEAFIWASLGTLQQMEAGQEIIDVYLPRGMYADYRRLCRSVDLVADDVLSYGFSRTVLGGRPP